MRLKVIALLSAFVIAAPLVAEAGPMGALTAEAGRPQPAGAVSSLGADAAVRGDTTAKIEKVWWRGRGFGFRRGFYGRRFGFRGGFYGRRFGFGRGFGFRRFGYGYGWRRPFFRRRFFGFYRPYRPFFYGPRFGFYRPFYRRRFFF